MTETLEFVPAATAPPMRLDGQQWLDMLFTETDLESQFALDDVTGERSG